MGVAPSVSADVEDLDVLPGCTVYNHLESYRFIELSSCGKNRMHHGSVIMVHLQLEARVRSLQSLQLRYGESMRYRHDWPAPKALEVLPPRDGAIHVVIAGDTPGQSGDYAV